MILISCDLSSICCVSSNIILIKLTFLLAFFSGTFQKISTLISPWLTKQVCLTTCRPWWLGRPVPQRSQPVPVQPMGASLINSLQPFSCPFPWLSQWPLTQAIHSSQSPFSCLLSRSQYKASRRSPMLTLWYLKQPLSLFPLYRQVQLHCSRWDILSTPILSQVNNSWIRIWSETWSRA